MPETPYRGAVSTTENPYLPHNALDPFELYGRLREAGPVIWLAEVGVWAVFRDAQCREILNDWKRFGNAGGGGVANYYREKPWRSPSVVFEVDPPDHTRTRRVLGRTLSPKAVKELEERTAHEASLAVARVVASKRFDVIEDFAKPFVLKIVPDALGMPEEGRENLLVYNKYLLKGRGTSRHSWTEEELEEAAEVNKWVEAICQRDAISSDGLGAQIYAAADREEISPYEANMLIRSFLSAGTDTTFGAIANTVHLLMQHPGQWESLRADPSKARGAYEEALRYRSPAQTIARNTMDDTEFYGAELGKHDKIICFVGSANRDPERWDNPDAFEIDRDAVGHLGLGIGIHGCVGQMIARMEASKLLAELAQRATTISFTDEPVRMQPSGRGLAALPVEITA